MSPPGFVPSIYNESAELMISISSDINAISDAVSAIVVPENAITEPGYIKAFTARADSGSKHEYHALAQMAYFQFQDDELEIGMIEGSCLVSLDGKSEMMTSGMIIYRDSTSALYVIAHENVACKKLLEAAYRYCTRWVRLDI